MTLQFRVIQSFPIFAIPFWYDYIAFTAQIHSDLKSAQSY